MRRFFVPATVVMAAILLAACAKSTASRLDERTFRIEGPEVPGGSDVPNRRLADQICPHGYRVLDSAQSKFDYQSPPSTTWTIRCL